MTVCFNKPPGIITGYRLRTIPGPLSPESTTVAQLRNRRLARLMAVDLAKLGHRVEIDVRIVASWNRHAPTWFLYERLYPGATSCPLLPSPNPTSSSSTPTTTSSVSKRPSSTGLERQAATRKPTGSAS